MADLDRPFPDRGKEGIRQAVLAARADIAWNTSSSDISFDLVDTLFELVGNALDAVTALQAAVADLTARVEALEAPAPTEASP